MTRINLVDPHHLSDDHLGGEFVELPRVAVYVQGAIDKGIEPEAIAIPEKFVLGQGHVTFFYDKIKFLIDRYELLKLEMLRRGRNVDIESFAYYRSRFEAFRGTAWFNDYEPYPEEIYLSMARLVKMSQMDRALAEVDLAPKT